MDAPFSVSETAFAMPLRAGNDAFAFSLAAERKPAALTGRAFRIFCAARGRQRALSFGGTGFGGPCLRLKGMLILAMGKAYLYLDVADLVLCSLPELRQRCWKSQAA